MNILLMHFLIDQLLMPTKFLIAFFLVGNCFFSFAQEISEVHIAPEKIYLQLDNSVYTTDQIIWFRAIVVNAIDHKPTQLSRVLYVELISQEEQVEEFKIVKLENGVGAGFIQLIDGYPMGTFQIRAYTEWNKNFGTDFIFEQYIQIFPTQKDQLNCFKNIILSKEKNEYYAPQSYPQETLRYGESSSESSASDSDGND